MRKYFLLIILFILFLGARFQDYAAKTTPATNDLILISDSADSNNTKKLTYGNLQTAVVAAVPPTTPGGNDTNIQYNNSGAFGGDSNLTWSATDDLTITGTLGSEEITNGTFNADLTGWTYGGNISWETDGAGGGRARFSGASGNLVHSTFATVAGNHYRITYTVGDRSAGSIRATFAGDIGNDFSSVSANGSYSHDFYADDAQNITFQPFSFDGYLDDISVKKIPSKITNNDNYMTSDTPFKYFRTLDGLGHEFGLLLEYEVNKTSGKDYGLYINQIDTASPDDSKILSLNSDYAEIMYVDNTGATLFKSLSLSANIVMAVDTGIGLGGNNGSLFLRGGSSNGGAMLTLYGRTDNPGYGAFSLEGSTISSDVPPADSSITGVSAYASAATNLDGGALQITAGSGSSGSAGDADGAACTISGGQGYGTGDGGNVLIDAGVANGSGSSGNIILGATAGNVHLSNGQVVNVTTVSAASYNVLATDYILHVAYTDTGTVDIDLKTAQLEAGRVLIIKDVELNASANNITITTEGAETIDEQNSAVISGDGDSLMIYCDGSNYFIF